MQIINLHFSTANSLFTCHPMLQIMLATKLIPEREAFPIIYLFLIKDDSLSSANTYSIPHYAHFKQQVSPTNAKSPLLSISTITHLTVRSLKATLSVN